MKQTLQLKLSQHLTLTPQLQQSIRLLQLSTLELNQELERFLAENPLLEREDNEEEGEPVAAPINGAQTTSYESSEGGDGQPDEAQNFDESRPGDADWFLEGMPSGQSARDDSEDGEYPQLAADTPSLREHLLEQLSLTTLPARDRSLVAALIEALDDAGYLTQPLEEIVGLFPRSWASSSKSSRSRSSTCKTSIRPASEHAARRNAWSCSSSRCWRARRAASTRSRSCGETSDCSPRGFRAASEGAAMRRTRAAHGTQAHSVLNPRPGAAFGPTDTRYVIADVILRKVKNVWVASLNPAAMPKLRINRIYADILQANRGASGGQLAAQLQEARWLIKNVQQRFDTIQRVAQAIVDRQRYFFEHGEVAMRPLVLREIADTLGLHESTVSRVTTQKYMATPRGIFELKYFFGSHVGTDTGGACSATAIRALIKQLVAAEDGRKPLSDSKISEILGQQGIVVARRTIAKYRESLQIPPVNLRKSL